MERFTEQARKIIVRTEREARSLNHNYIGPEYLLLVLVRELDDVLVRVLPNVDLGELRCEVVRMLGSSRGEAGLTVGGGCDDHGF